MRAYATHFAISRDHENPESERVITESERFAVIDDAIEAMAAFMRSGDNANHGGAFRAAERTDALVAGARASAAESARSTCSATSAQYWSESWLGS